MPTQREVEQRLEESYALPANMRAMRTTPVEEIRAFNRRAAHAYLNGAVVLRERILARVIVELERHTLSEQRILMQYMVREGGMDRLADHAAMLYRATWKRGESVSTTRRRHLESLRRERVEVDMHILEELRGSAAGANVEYSQLYNIMEVAYALWYEAGARTIQSVTKAAKNATALTLSYIQKATGHPGFTQTDLLIAQITYETYYEVAYMITARLREINLAGFSDAMFETLRGTIRRELYERVEGGAGAQELAREIGKDLSTKYGTALPVESRDRLMLWARTEGAVIQNDALMKLGDRAGMNGKIWQTVGDNLVRPNHADNEADGVIPVGQAFSGDSSMDAGSGSADPFNCLLPGTIIQGTFDGALKANYSGPAVEIHTTQGNRLRCTINHPILTKDGFVRASLLQKGEQLISYRIGTGEGLEIPAPEHYAYKAPACIEEVFCTFVECAVGISGSMHFRRARAVDLYGDGEFIDDNINVVLLKGELLRDRHSSCMQGGKDGPFKFPHSAQSSSVFQSVSVPAAEGSFASTTCLPCRRALAYNEVAIPFERLPLQFLRFGSASHIDASVYEPFSEYAPVNTYGVADGLQGLPGGVALDKLREVRDVKHADLGSASYSDAIPDQCTADNPSVHKEFARELMERFPFEIVLDDIVDVFLFEYTGHVYDLQSPFGFIIADGCVVRNCRCVSGPAMLPRRSGTV